LAGGLELRVQSDTRHRYAPGEHMRLHLPVERCRLIAEE
jgi:hypothetical protein